MFTDHTHIHVDQHEFFNRVRQYMMCFESTLPHELGELEIKSSNMSHVIAPAIPPAVPQPCPYPYPVSLEPVEPPEDRPTK